MKTGEHNIQCDGSIVCYCDLLGDNKCIHCATYSGSGEISFLQRESSWHVCPYALCDCSGMNKSSDTQVTYNSVAVMKVHWDTMTMSSAHNLKMKPMHLQMFASSTRCVHNVLTVTCPCGFSCLVMLITFMLVS
jgi:hypothetical protein